MIFEFTDTIFIWRGPSPFYFVAMPPDQSADLKDFAGRLTYGWGVIPATVTIGSTRWTTSLIPKDGRYLVPLKDAIRRAEGLTDGDEVAVRIVIGD